MNILKVILHIVVLIMLILGWILYLCATKAQLKVSINKLGQLIKRNWRGLLWLLIYITLVVSSTIFVFRNWETCLEMQFFDHFNGYNIIWIFWIVLLLMPLISVDNQWFRIPNPLSKEQKQIEKAKEETYNKEALNRLESLEKDNSISKKEENSNGTSN